MVGRGVLAGALCALMTMVAPAGAATFTVAPHPSYDGLRLDFTAGIGERNRLSVRLDGSTLVIDDPGATLWRAKASTVPCQVAGSSARCALPERVWEVRADLGDGGDTFVSSAGHWNSAYGGQGKDVLRGSANPAQYSSLHGDVGDDRLIGDAGSAQFWGGPGADDFTPGSGGTSLHYDLDTTLGLTTDLRPLGVSVTLDGVADDGTFGEGDNARRGIHGIHGSEYADVLAGGDGAQVLLGGGGNDTLTGGAGGDFASGGSGDDVLMLRDGESDAFTCDQGSDRAVVDALDWEERYREPSSCETIDVG